MRTSAEYRWYLAFTAWQNAKNPAFKKLWEGVMDPLKEDLD